MWLACSFSGGQTHADVQLLWFNKTSTRIVESFMFEFTPTAVGSACWMQILDVFVQPREVVYWLPS